MIEQFLPRFFDLSKPEIKEVRLKPAEAWAFGWNYSGGYVEKLTRVRFDSELDFVIDVGHCWNTDIAVHNLLEYLNRWKTMQPHQIRVVDEKTELDDKLSKLDAFIGSALYFSLDEAEQTRLVHQQCAMSEYSDILKDRIAAFK